LEQTVAKNKRLSKGLLRFSLKRRNQTYIITGSTADTQGRINEREAPGKVVTVRPPKRLMQLVAFHIPSFQLCKNTVQKRQNWYDLAAYTSETIRV